ncbi:unnamed protein product [Ostreobium quekettii]|uniref:Fe2OG dioxygenase domain-containing protein n=1 Tax=Ostreobium quekettii TaxID=121088 RepID=A0A8S1IKK5_9CHLO|nr:unnamed protein product [Ostreobium quekettii]|eukprot:evm.model.scf_1352.4 EVM.evm.TU.scf_1352.4   scf_1352:27827-33346(-)
MTATLLLCCLCFGGQRLAGIGTMILSLQHPTVVLFKNFLSLKETEQLVERARRGMSRSQIVGVDKDSLLAQDRTSYGAWLSGHEASRVEKRIQDVVGVPREFGESIYVLRYQESQKYVPHYDNCGKQGEALSERCWRFVSRAGGPQCGEGFGGATCGDRLATFIMYLRSPERGGQTVFPLARSRGDQHESTSIQNKNMDKDSWWCSGDDILMISPEPGDAVLFWDYIPKPGVEDPHMYKRRGSLKNGTMDTEAVADEAAYHGGCPVMEGEKWIATKWMRSAQYF